MARNKMPSHTELVQPTLTAFHKLGGTVATSVVDEAVIKNLKLTRKVRNLPHGTSDTAKGGGRSEIRYRLAWVRTALKKYGLLDNPQRGYWRLTPLGKRTKSVDSRKILTQAHAKRPAPNDLKA